MSSTHWELPPTYSRMLGGRTSVSIEQFLSDANRRQLHGRITRTVYERTGGQVALGQQSDSELQILMIRHIQSNDERVYHSVARLNADIVERSVSIILENIGAYMEYMKHRAREAAGDAPMGITHALVDRPMHTRESKETSLRSPF